MVNCEGDWNGLKRIISIPILDQLPKFIWWTLQSQKARVRQMSSKEETQSERPNSSRLKLTFRPSEKTSYVRKRPEGLFHDFCWQRHLDILNTLPSYPEPLHTFTKSSLSVTMNGEKSESNYRWAEFAPYRPDNWNLWLHEWSARPNITMKRNCELPTVSKKTPETEKAFSAWPWDSILFTSTIRFFSKQFLSFWSFGDFLWL